MRKREGTVRIRESKRRENVSVVNG